MKEPMKCITLKEFYSVEDCLTAVLFCNEYKRLTKNSILKIYTFCKSHYNNKYCKQNLLNLRNAVTKIYLDVNY